MTSTLSRMIGISLICAAFLIPGVLIPASARAAGPQPVGKPQDNISVTEKIASSDSPIHITAHRMEVLQEERIVTFEGHVIVKQDDTTITGNRLKVVGLAPQQGKPAAGNAGQKAAPNSGVAEKIDYIEVDGDVKVTQQDRIATSEKAIFYQQEQKIVLRGRPKVMKGRDKIEGSVITIYLQQNRSVVEGGKEVPVQAVLFPSKKE